MPLIVLIIVGVSSGVSVNMNVSVSVIVVDLCERTGVLKHVMNRMTFDQCLSLVTHDDQDYNTYNEQLKKKWNSLKDDIAAAFNRVNRTREVFRNNDNPWRGISDPDNEARERMEGMIYMLEPCAGPVARASRVYTMAPVVATGPTRLANRLHAEIEAQADNGAREVIDVDEEENVGDDAATVNIYPDPPAAP
jgi:hypothetical protein